MRGYAEVLEGTAAMQRTQHEAPCMLTISRRATPADPRALLQPESGQRFEPFAALAMAGGSPILAGC